MKQVNDRLGRPEGDQLLATVAALLAARSRESNIVARYEGDEFAILMPEANTLQAEILAERLRAGLEADEVLHAREVTVSIGIAAHPDHGRSPGEILQVAEAGVRLAKQCGGNCVKVASLSPKPEDAERSKRLLEASLEAAAKPMFPRTPEADEGGAARDGSHGAGDRDSGGRRTTSRDAEQVNPLLDTITALAFAVQAKGPYRKDHSQAVSRLAARVALQAGLSQAEIEEIRLAGLVHDIGKIHVPEYVLQKPTLLTAQEFEIMKSHAAWGAKMLEFLNAEGIERIVLHHHERYDGKGYPSGLAGDRIPLGARIVAVVECFEIMLSDLRYKSARTFEDALAELRRCSGTQFDPAMVATFLEWIQTQAGPRVS
jgi:diguanylate cyclase (GGDEF)-like protein/putative nucleotidyltransferase with HDIG domain